MRTPSEPNTSEPVRQNGERRVRTLLVSDIHLGCRYAQSENFRIFLDHIRPDQLFVLGDFLDGWKLNRRWHWTPVSTRIFARMAELAKQGTQIYYTPGNHDAFLRDPSIRELTALFGLKVRMEDEFVFEALDGHKYLVTHGDKFDTVETNHQWLSQATSMIYDPLLSFNWWSSRLCGRTDRSPYAMCAAFKDAVKKTVRFVSSYEQLLRDHATLQGCDGVICGHIHKPNIQTSDDFIYLNTGDWVENCTALIETFDGSIHLESYYASVPTRTLPASSMPSDHEACSILELVHTDQNIKALSE